MAHKPVSSSTKRSVSSSGIKKEEDNHPPEDKKRRRTTPTFTDSDLSDYPSMDEDECKDLLRPVKKQLKLLKSSSEDQPREQKVLLLRECLSAIGSRIDEIIAIKESRGGQG